MVEAREKRDSNAAREGSSPTVPPPVHGGPPRSSMKVGRGRTARPTSARKSVPAATSQRPRKGVAGGSTQDPCTNVERRSRPRTRGSTAGNRPATLLHAASNVGVEPDPSRSCRSPQKRTARRTPRPHGRREAPPPSGGSARDEGSGAERSDAPREGGGVAANGHGTRSPGGWRTACATPPPSRRPQGRRERSKDLDGDQSPGRVGRRIAGNGGRRYGLICGATPRRWCITRSRNVRRHRQRW